MRLGLETERHPRGGEPTTDRPGATIRDMRLWLKVLVIASLPVAFAGLGYLYVTVLWQPPLVGHSCPSRAPVSACSYHPLLVSGYTWTVLGALVGLWVA
jgi:hypothetical protein